MTSSGGTSVLGGGSTATTLGTIDVTVDAVADAPTLTVTNAAGNEDSAIALNIDAALTDTTLANAITSKLGDQRDQAFDVGGDHRGLGSERQLHSGRQRQAARHLGHFLV